MYFTFYISSNYQQDFTLNHSDNENKKGPGVGGRSILSNALQKFKSTGLQLIILFLIFVGD